MTMKNFDFEELYDEVTNYYCRIEECESDHLKIDAEEMGLESKEEKLAELCKAERILQEYEIPYTYEQMETETPYIIANVSDED